MSLNLKSNNYQSNIKEAKTNDSVVYEFEGFRLDAAHLMLTRNDEEISLTPKVVETLLALVERHGEIVGKDELIERLWKNAFVEESNLIQNIYVLRKTIGALPDGRPLIETLRRRGYRFNAEVTIISEDKPVVREKEAIQIAEKTPQNLLANDSSSAAKKPRFLAAGALICGSLLILTGLIWFNLLNLPHQTHAASTEKSNVAFKRLTPDVDARTPIISQDGKYLAYAQIEHGKDSVWLKDIASDAAVQLLPPIDHGIGYKVLHFSPDGAQLYYSTQLPTAPNGTIFRLTLANREQQQIATDDISPSVVSPDGKQLAFINSKYDLMITNADGSGEARVLRHPEAGEHFVAWASQMSWSPDGTRIVLCGGHNSNGSDYAGLLEISVSDGSERIVPTPPVLQQIDDVAYLGDNAGWLVTARQNQAEPFQIWRIAPAGDKATRITLDNHDYNWFSLSGNANMLVAEQGLGHFNIWTAPLSDAKNIKQLTFGNAALDGSEGIAFEPEGKIIYSSTRSNNVDLWIMNPDGSNQKQLTQNAGSWNGRPRVTPDGRYIVFASMRSGPTELWRMDADGGNPKQLTGSADQAFRASISPDGNWVYYNTESDGSIWKVSIDGGTPILASSEKALFPSISPDGKLIAGTKFEKTAPNLWRIVIISAQSGELLKTFDIQASRRILVWTPDSKSLISMTYNWGSLWEHPIDGGAPRQLTDYPNDQNPFFAVSPDDKQIAFARGNSFSEAVLISGLDLNKTI